MVNASVSVRMSNPTASGHVYPVVTGPRFLECVSRHERV